MLSSAGVHLDATSFAAEWDVYAWPQKIAKRADALAAALSTRRAQYHSEMGEAQQEFVERLKGLADQVRAAACTSYSVVVAVYIVCTSCCCVYCAAVSCYTLP